MSRAKDKILNKTIGQKIREARNVKPLVTQSKLGKAIGVTFQQVQKYEKGTNYTKEFKTRQMVKYLGRSDYDGFLRDYNVHTH